MTEMVFQLIPGVTRSLRVRILVNGIETVDDFLVDLPIVDPREGDHWQARIELTESRGLLRRWEIRRSWLGKALAWARSRPALSGLWRMR